MSGGYYTIIDEASGVVIKKVRRPTMNSLMSSVRPGQIYIEGHGINGKRQLYKNGIIVPKPESLIKMSQDAKKVLLENFENPTRITITGNEESFHRTITDGAYQFSIDTPGDYTVKCESDVELPIEFKVKI